MDAISPIDADIRYEYDPFDEFLVGRMREIRRECPHCNRMSQKIDGECEECGMIVKNI